MIKFAFMYPGGLRLDLCKFAGDVEPTKILAREYPESICVIQSNSHEVVSEMYPTQW